MFISLRGGMAELVEALVDRLPASLRAGCGVRRVERREDDSYLLILEDGSEMIADAVAITTPAYVAARLVRDAAPQAAQKLEGIRYVSTGTLSLAFRADEVQHPLNGFGLLIPRSEQRPINAITWTSSKLSHRAPEGYVLLRVFFGGSRRPEMLEKADHDLLAIARGELAQLMGIRAEPVLHLIHRGHNANPQYDVGHLQHVATIEAMLPPGLVVAGSPFRGIGIPDCVHQAQDAARVLGAVASRQASVRG